MNQRILWEEVERGLQTSLLIDYQLIYRDWINTVAHTCHPVIAAYVGRHGELPTPIKKNLDDKPFARMLTEQMKVSPQYLYGFGVGFSCVPSIEGENLLDDSLEGWYDGTIVANAARRAGRLALW